MKGTLITPVLARLIALERVEGRSIKFISESSIGMDGSGPTYENMCCPML